MSAKTDRDVSYSYDDLLSGKINSYSVVIGVAKRAREIVSEHELRGEPLDVNPVILALQDFKENVYEIVPADK
ncbi:MAG: DNA-directed RNA polymerase subunit omega [Candidatus Improbicoccus devescovinae]|nr:MAG: DNA-directed RNA polymerase subunit omega [Candidatus Improbicoccus devescovinae]